MPEEGGTDEQVKETYAFFGLALYWANCLELGMVQTLLQVDFLASVREDFAKDRKPSRN